MAILGGASTIRSTGIAASRAASRRASSSRSRGKGGRGSSGRARHYSPPRSSRSSYSSRSSTRGGGRATVSRTPRYTPGSAASRQHHIDVYRRTHPKKAKPILPIPSADAIAELFSQIAGYKREYGQLGVNARASKRELTAARGLFLKQLLQAFEQNRTSALEDFASRGLADSGIQNEALAKLQNEYGSQRSAYETEYTNNINSIMRQLQGRRSDILARRSAAERRYNQLRAQRAAALKAAGYGG